ncbi:MAG: RNA-dependent DNA polymerase [Deltaproteobacteria bacterium]|nr:RNA-dependent DNA polymerase [Deltaproteobacteria bacterium]
MKRFGNFFEKITDFRNLILAYKKAVRGKRYWKSTLEVTFNLERELLKLRDELRNGEYTPGAFRTFVIKEPKERMISAAPFRDRIVHHALCNIIEPIFERSFINDSYACRKGKGTHKALGKFKEFSKDNKFVLRGDINKFFPSIDHEVLLKIIARKIKDKKCLQLIERIVDFSNRQEDVIEYFDGDGLFTPIERKKGLPIGNQTSQFFANVYLDPLDHFVKERLRCKNYLRYCDDFAVFSNDREELESVLVAVSDFIAGLRLKLNKRKTRILKTSEGVNFLGFIVFPGVTRIRGENVRRFKKRLKENREKYKAGKMSLKSVRHSFCGWIGHAMHADSYRLRGLIFNDNVL